MISRTVDVLLTKKEAAQLLNVSIRTLENYIKDGTIVPISIGKLKRFPRSIDKFLSDCVTTKFAKENRL